jgi:predicted peptidase
MKKFYETFYSFTRITIKEMQMKLLMFLTLNLSILFSTPLFAGSSTYNEFEYTNFSRRWCGDTSCNKGHYHVPNNPKGIILFLHGTFGTKDVVKQINGAGFANEAIKRGYAIIALSNSVGSQWEQSDYTNLIKSIKHLRDKQSELVGLPVYLLGHSQGAGTASALAYLYPGKFSGLIMSGAKGVNPAFTETSAKSLPPVMWLCGKNDGITNYRDCQSNYETIRLLNDCDNCRYRNKRLYGKKVLTKFSFTMIKGIDASKSIKIYKAMTENNCDKGFLDQDGYQIHNPKGVTGETWLEHCFESTDIELTSNEESDLIATLEMYYSEHKMRNLEGTITITFDWLDSLPTN